MFTHRMALAINCGYARVAAFEIAQKVSQNRWQRYFENEEKISDLFLKQFQHRRAFTFNTPRAFTRNVAALIPHFNKEWAYKNGKEEYMQHFSEASWAKLTPEAKNQHTLTSCTVCLSCSPLVQCKFPGTPRRDKENYAQSCTKTLKRLKKSKPQLPLCDAKKTALERYTNLADSFELNTGHSLNECLSLTPKSRMMKRLTIQENKQLQRKQI